MRLLDRYVMGTFLKVFAGTLVVFSVSAVALDWVSRLGHFSSQARVADTFASEYSTAALLLRFYAAYLPYLLKEVIPFVTVAAGLFTLSSLLRSNEVFPVLAAGVSARRLLLPVFLCGLVVSAGHLAFQEYVIPSLNREHIAIKRLFAGDRTNSLHNLAHLRAGDGTITSVESYRFDDQSLRGVVIMRPWTDAGFDRWTVPLLVPSGMGWEAPEGGVVHPAGIGAVARRLEPGAGVEIGVSPDDVEALASKQGTTELSMTQLLSLVRKFPDRRNLEVALHKQIARPLTSFVLLLVGIPTLLALGRSLVLGAGIAFGLSAIYYFGDIFFTSLGDRGDLAPVVAAYLPLSIFLSAGVARLATVPT